MASIDSPHISGPPQAIGSDVLLFTIRYTAKFTFEEIGQSFDEAAKLWEDDSNENFGGADDQITPYPVPRSFVVDGHVMPRVLEVTATRTQLDTEWGNEEIYGQIWLRKTGSLGPAAHETFTIGIVSLDV